VSRLALLALVVALASTARASGVTKELIDRPGGEPFDWNKIEASNGCRGEPAPKCVARLRKQLAAELQKHKLTLVAGELCRATVPPPRCERFESPCMPVAALWIEQLAALGTDAAPAAPELLIAEKRQDPWFTAHVLDAMVSAQMPRALELALANLRDADVECRWLGLGALGKLGPKARSAVPELERAVDIINWKDRPQLFRVLVKVGGPDSVAALQRQLDSPFWSVQQAAAEALAGFGSIAKPALPTLGEMAATHWKYGVRDAAARAATKIGGKEIAATPIHGSGTRIAFGDGGWMVGTTAPERFEDIDRVVNVEDRCNAMVNGKRNLRFAVWVGDGCLVGVDGGEWGGEISFVSKGETTSLWKQWYLNPLVLVPVHGSWVALMHMDHMSARDGGLLRIDHGPTGWTAREFFELSDSPSGFHVDANGDLKILTQSHALFRVGPDLKVEAIQ